MTFSNPDHAQGHPVVVVKPGNSAVQVAAESEILAAVESTLGVSSLRPASVDLADGVAIKVDGCDEARSMFVEAYARQGALKGAQPKKVAQDILKLSLVRETYPRCPADHRIRKHRRRVTRSGDGYSTPRVCTASSSWSSTSLRRHDWRSSQPRSGSTGERPYERSAEMSESSDRTRAFVQRRNQRLREALVFLDPRLDGAGKYEILAHVSSAVPPTPDDLELNNSGELKWETAFLWYSTNLVKAGWLVKDGAGHWSITDAGREALAQYPDPEDIHAVSAHAYQEWYAASQRCPPTRVADPGIECQRTQPCSAVAGRRVRVTSGEEPSGGARPVRQVGTAGGCR